MLVLLRLAIRNLKQHRAKTIIIGTLVCMGTAILISGSAVINAASSGIEQTFIDNFTGNVVITGVADAEVSLFGVHANMMSEVVPTVPRYKDVLAHAKSIPGLTAQTGQITGYGIINAGETAKVFTMLFGIQPEEYRNMFSSIDITEGSYLKSGEEGILLERSMVVELRAASNAPYSVGDPVLLSGFGAAGFRVREVPLRGIFTFKQQTEMLNRLAFIDAQSLRSLLGMTVGTVQEIEIDEEATALLSVDSFDSMFGDEMVETSTESDVTLPAPQPINDITTVPATAEYADTVWHFLLLKFDPSANTSVIIDELNGWLSSQEIAAKAIGWKKASAGFGATADVLRGVFIAAILIVAAVAVIIMMNTLTVSVFERTSEIGTMRALGARKSFVWKMLFTETLAVTILFGAIGIAAGALVVIGLRMLRLEATDMITNTLFGGPVFLPSVRVGSLFTALGLTAFIGVIAGLYPISIAMRIPPVKAIGVE